MTDQPASRTAADTACLDADEAREKALRDYAILDTPTEPLFDEIAQIAADICEAPIAVVNLVARDRQWFKAEIGIGQRELPLDVSICRHAILQPGLFIVPDLTQDQRFVANPLVDVAEGLRFYAGALLQTPDGVAIGTVCVLDTAPRPDGLTARQERMLQALARQVMSELEMRRTLRARSEELLHTKGTEMALRETEERYRLAAAATSDAIWDWDLVSNRILWNEALQEAYGHPLSEVDAAGEWWIEHIHPEDRDRVHQSIHRVIDGESGGDRWTDEYRFRRVDGSYAEVLDRGHVIRGADGKAVRMIGAMLDLSERKAAEREVQARERQLRVSEERFRQLTELAPAIIWFGNVDGGLSYLNPYWYAYTGQTEAEALPLGWADVIHPDDLSTLDAAWTTARTNGTLYEVEARLRRHDGAYRWFLIRAEPLRDEKGAVNGWLGQDTDIDDRKAAEAGLARLNANLEERVTEALAERRLWAEVFEATDATIAVVRSDYRLLAANDAYVREFKRLFGVVPVIGENLIALLEGRPERDLAQEVWQRALSGDAFSIETELGSGEERRCYDLRFNALRNPDGEIIAAYQFAVDVTERLEEQKRLRDAEDALRQVQKMDAVGQLTGGIAHDFNNLLTGILGSLELMQLRMQQGRHDEIERYVRAAATSANRAAALTHRLLAFSRRQPLNPQAVNANRLLTGMEELLRRTIGERIQLEIVTAAGLWPTRCDANQLENAILNLAINARDAMPDGGNLTIETCNTRLDRAYTSRVQGLQPGQYICVAVTDTGTGMTPDVIEKAFEPFFTTKPIGQGTGLGLSMIYGFARQSEGHARIYSEPGHGTTFKIYLPRHLGVADETEDQAEALTEQHAGSGEIVLVVEDEHSVRDLVVDVLRDLGYHALEAVDGPSGLALIQSGARIDLMVTDVGLPGLNGRQLADEARRLRPGLQVLFMTGYAESAAIASGFLEPGMEMITKPFALEAVAARVRAMVEDGKRMRARP
ncbi:MAG TPA: PAS domain S-box protein [Allosphingosinicella sp.]|jgi:PAS domain S-box-containing protein